MVTKRQNFAPVRSGENCSGYGNGKKFITVHQTGNTNKGANAQMHANLQMRVWEASWHWQVDDKEAIQSFPHSVKCWHASDGERGDGNANSIGAEGCINSDGDYKKSVQNMAELVAWIAKEESIPVANIKQHHDFARDNKNCPSQIRAGKEGINWTKFIQMVQVELDKLNGKTTVEKPVVESAKAYKVVVDINGYINAGDAKNKQNAKTKVVAGNYTVFSEANGMINVTSKSGIPGSWINPSENKAPVAVAKPSTSNQSGIVKSYKEDGIFYTDPRPDDRIYVRDQPSTKGKVVAEYYIYGVNESLPVEYHAVHLGNGYVWLQYDRKRDGKVIGQGYIPCREYKKGKYGALWGTIK